MSNLDSCSELIKNLIAKLKTVYDNENFIIGILSDVWDNENHQKAIIEFIDKGVDVDDETVTVLAIELSTNN